MKTYSRGIFIDEEIECRAELYDITQGYISKVKDIILSIDYDLSISEGIKRYREEVFLKSDYCLPEQDENIDFEGTNGIPFEILIQFIPKGTKRYLMVLVRIKSFDSDFISGINNDYFPSKQKGEDCYFDICINIQTEVFGKNHNPVYFRTQLHPQTMSEFLKNNKIKQVPMFKFTFLNRDKDIQKEYGLGKYNEKRRKKTFAEKYLSLHKVIYTDPIDTPKEQVLDERSYLQAVDDQKMVLNIRSYSLFELLFILPFFILFFYLLIYQPCLEYYTRVDVVQELVETGKSSYPYQIVEKYGSVTDIDYYKRHGINRTRLVAMNDSALIFFIPMGLVACVGFSFWAYIVTKNCRDLLTFNRQDGTVLYRYNYGLKTSICQFNDSIFQSHLASLTNADSTYLAMRFPHVKGYATLSIGVPYISMSFYVWYMDKNRPLPPGTAFDPYREQDYLRRREEGFPDPLYPSGIPTPEWDGAITKYNDKGAKSRKLKMYDPEFKQVAYAEDQFRKSQTKKTDI